MGLKFIKNQFSLFVENYSILSFRALLNSPLIRRKKKPANDETNKEESLTSNVKENFEAEKKKNLKSNLHNLKNQREDHCSFNLLMDDFDSDSDEDMVDHKDHRLLKSHSGRDGESAYHNLETFQKKQLKQKV